MNTYSVLKNGEWITVAKPENGEKFREFSAIGVFLRESYWYEQETPISKIKSKITRLAFRNRFTFAEKVAIAEAAKTDAVVEVLQKDQDAATYIDLSRTDTQQGVQLLASKGLITAERVSEILSLQVLPDEEFRG